MAARPQTATVIPITRARRRRIEALIEAMLAILDELDGDADMELTAVERRGAGFLYSGPDDLEDGHDVECDPSESGIADADGLAEQCPSEWRQAV